MKSKQRGIFLNFLLTIALLFLSFSSGYAQGLLGLLRGFRDSAHLPKIRECFKKDGQKTAFGVKISIDDSKPFGDSFFESDFWMLLRNCGKKISAEDWVETLPIQTKLTLFGQYLKIADPMNKADRTVKVNAFSACVKISFQSLIDNDLWGIFNGDMDDLLPTVLNNPKNMQLLFVQPNNDFCSKLNYFNQFNRANDIRDDKKELTTIRVVKDVAVNKLKILRSKRSLSKQESSLVQVLEVLSSDQANKKVTDQVTKEELEQTLRKIQDGKGQGDGVTGRF